MTDRTTKPKPVLVLFVFLLLYLKVYPLAFKQIFKFRFNIFPLLCILLKKKKVFFFFLNYRPGSTTLVFTLQQQQNSFRNFRITQIQFTLLDFSQHQRLKWPGIFCKLSRTTFSLMQPSLTGRSDSYAESPRGTGETSKEKYLHIWTNFQPDCLLMCFLEPPNRVMYSALMSLTNQLDFHYLYVK